MDAAVKPRIGGFPPGRYPWYVRLIFWLQRRKYGCELDPALLWGRVALAYAEAITDSARRVDDTLFSRLQRHFTDQEIVELTALIAFQNLSSRFNAALGVPAQGFCEGSPRASSRATKPGRRGSA